MTLQQLREAMTLEEWREFAERAGYKPLYLDNVRRNSYDNLSPKAAKALVEADSRLTIEELLYG